VVTDHDSRVIARRRVSARAWELGDLLDWAVAQAVAAGFASVTVACELTGHRWRVLDQLAAGRGSGGAGRHGGFCSASAPVCPD
jgi:transposase